MSKERRPASHAQQALHRIIHDKLYATNVKEGKKGDLLLVFRVFRAEKAPIKQRGEWILVSCAQKDLPRSMSPRIIVILAFLGHTQKQQDKSCVKSVKKGQLQLLLIQLIVRYVRWVGMQMLVKVVYFVRSVSLRREKNLKDVIFVVKANTPKICRVFCATNALLGLFHRHKAIATAMSAKEGSTLLLMVVLRARLARPGKGQVKSHIQLVVSVFFFLCSC